MEMLLTPEEWAALSPESRHRMNLLLIYPCEWHVDDDEANAWLSACGLTWWFEVGSPIENEMAYCPKCGRHLTQLAPDAGDSAVSTSLVNASAESTSQAESAPTQRG